MALGISQLCDAPGAGMSDVRLSPEQQMGLDVARLVQAGADAIKLRSVDEALQFQEFSVDLATLASVGAIEFPIAGVELVFSQVGSSPGAALVVKGAGTLSTIVPGCRFSQPFAGFTLLAAAGCATSGTARLIAVKSKGYDYQEPVAIQAGTRLTTLLGSVASDGSLEFVSVTPDTNPSGASPSGSFDVSGFRAIDVYCDLGAANRYATVNVWFQPRGSTQWFLNQSAQVTSMSAVAANLTTMPAFQQFTMGLFGEPGKLYLVSDTSGFGAVGFHVKGIY